MTLREYKGMTQYSNRRIASVLGCSYSVVQNNLKRRTNFACPDLNKRLKTIARMEEIIRGNPADRLLCIQEWEEFTGEEWKEL